MKKQLIVAKFREDVSWVAACPFETIIYDKSLPLRWKRNKSLPLVDQWQAQAPLHALPNIGREAHTYLYHIIKHYACLADLTFFTQADPEHHLHGCADMMFSDEHPSLHFYCNSTSWECDGEGGPHHKGLPVASMYEAITKEKAPGQFTYYPGAIFSVTAAEIRSKPVTFYEGILAQLDVHPYAFAYVMERLWHTLLTTCSRTPDV